MSLSSSQISGSRAAPRDPRDLSGRRPASVFHDRRQYKMAVESDDDEKMPPRKENALSSKGARGRTKAIHRSFSATPASARASARSQVDDIVSGGDESDDNFRERLHRELDGDRIGRLREMNKQRLEALEKKLLDLHRQKHDIDGQSDEDARPSYFRHTKTYQPESYAESKEKRGDAGQTSEEGLTTDDGAENQAGARASGTSRGVSGDESEGGGGGGYTSDPGARKRSSAGMEGTGARVRISESTQNLSKLIQMRYVPRRRKAPQTKPEPFSFQNRPPNPSTRKLKFEEEMLARKEHEEMELRKQFVAKNVPKTTTEPMFEKKKQKQTERSEEIRRKVCPLSLSAVSLSFCLLGLFSMAAFFLLSFPLLAVAGRLLPQHRTLSFFLPLSLSLSSLSLSLPLSLSLTHSLSITRTHTHTHTHTRTHTHTLSLSLSLSHTHTHTHSLSIRARTRWQSQNGPSSSGCRYVGCHVGM
jgi:hypothetical protein